MAEKALFHEKKPLNILAISEKVLPLQPQIRNASKEDFAMRQ